MNPRLVLPPKGVDLFVEGQRAPAQRGRGSEQEVGLARIQVGPVDEDHGALHGAEDVPRLRPVNVETLLLQSHVRQQPVGTLDTVLLHRRAGHRPAQRRHRQPGAHHGRDHRRCQGFLTFRVHPGARMSEPSVRQSRTVHAVSSDLMFVLQLSLDHETACTSISHLSPCPCCDFTANLWGYLRVRPLA